MFNFQVNHDHVTGVMGVILVCDNEGWGDLIKTHYTYTLTFHNGELIGETQGDYPYMSKVTEISVHA